MNTCLIRPGVRSQHAMPDVPLGHVVLDTKGATWVFIGWELTMFGRSMVFVTAADPSHDGGHFYYKASLAATIVAKLPSLSEFVRPEDVYVSLHWGEPMMA